MLIHCGWQVGFYFSPERLGLLGSVVVDMQGQHLPVQRVQKGPFVAYEKPQGIAYISNLAVAPKARRQGVGEKLLKAAELVRKACTLSPLLHAALKACSLHDRGAGLLLKCVTVTHL
jgi:GNAT superfamily N-acetyltransferase